MLFPFIILKIMNTDDQKQEMLIKILENQVKLYDTILNNWDALDPLDTKPNETILEWCKRK